MDTVKTAPKTRTVVYGIAPGIRLKVTQTVSDDGDTPSTPTIVVTPSHN